MAAILDAILKITPLWIPDGNLTGLNGFIDLQNHGVDTKITTLRQTMTDLLPFKCTAAILDAILKITPFRKSDFLRFLVCYSGHQVLPKTVEKPFVAICLGLGTFCRKLTRLTVQYANIKYMYSFFSFFRVNNSLHL